MNTEQAGELNEMTNEELLDELTKCAGDWTTYIHSIALIRILEILLKEDD